MTLPVRGVFCHFVSAYEIDFTFSCVLIQLTEHWKSIYEKKLCQRYSKVSQYAWLYSGHIIGCNYFHLYPRQMKTVNCETEQNAEFLPEYGVWCPHSVWWVIYKSSQNCWTRAENAIRVSGVLIVSGESVTNLLKIVEPELRMQLGGDLEL